MAKENTLIAGDTLFQGSIGRTDLPGGSYERSFRIDSPEVAGAAGQCTIVIPGHGPTTTITKSASETLSSKAVSEFNQAL